MTFHDIDTSVLKEKYQAAAKAKGFTFDPEWQAAVDEVLRNTRHPVRNDHEKLLNGLTSVENVIMVAAFAIMVICTFTQVLNRNFFKLSMPWLDEASTYSMIFMALIGTEVGLRDGTQISVTAVVDKFYGRTRQVIMIVAKIVLLVFSVSVLISSIKLVGLQLATGQTSSAMGLPMAVPYSALVISFAMIVFVQTITTIKMIVRLKDPNVDTPDTREESAA